LRHFLRVIHADDMIQMKIYTKLFKKGAIIKTNVKLLEGVKEYLDVTEYLPETFDVDKPWYRGVSHAKYALIPKVYRDHLWYRHKRGRWFQNDLRLKKSVQYGSL